MLIFHDDAGLICNRGRHRYHLHRTRDTVAIRDRSPLSAFDIAGVHAHGGYLTVTAAPLRSPGGLSGHPSPISVASGAVRRFWPVLVRENGPLWTDPGAVADDWGAMGAQKRRSADTDPGSDAPADDSADDSARTPAPSFAESGLTWREWTAARHLEAGPSAVSRRAVTDDSGAG